MAEFKLGRIRFVWKSTWGAGTVYYVDDVVKKGGNIYICRVGHTANANFYTDLNASTPKWNLMSGGQSWSGDWTVSTAYAVNDLVKYGGSVYICKTAHTSAATAALGLEQDVLSWETFSEGFDWKGDWTVSTRYKINDLVKYGGTTYVCNTGHTSQSTVAAGLEVDQFKWDYFNQGLEYKGTWSGVSVRYKINDLVKYGGSTWICTANHVSSASFDTASFSVFGQGLEYENTWSSSTTYQIGDIVAYGGNQYVAKTVHSNQTPSTSTANWSLFSQGYSFQGDWSNTTTYKIGEVVRLNGYTYAASQDCPRIVSTITNTAAGTKYFTGSAGITTGMVSGMAVRFTGTTFGNVFTTATYYVKTVVSTTSFTISTQPGGTEFTPTTASGTMTATVTPIPPDTVYWNRLNSGIKWQGVWADDTEYFLGDAVRYGSNTYICILAHRSESDDGSTIASQGGGAANSRPDQDTAGLYWNALTIGSEVSTLTTKGDLVYYSGSGPARLPIGTEGQILTVGANNVPEWAYLWESANVYYVAPHGTDAPYPIGGATLQNPWKTIRYACEQVEQGALNPNAQYLLEMNRAFIQREVTEWIDYQVTNNISPFTSAFDYDEYKCERDTGFLIDRLIWDIGHGGNLKTLAAALTYVNALSGDILYATGEDGNGTGTYSRLSLEGTNDVAAYNYMLTVINAVLGNTAPAANYQTLNGDNSTSKVSQYINTAYQTESGATTTIATLVGIITTALTDQAATNLPDRTVPSGVIHVKTGTYTETLPIIVPAEHCVLGDEVRATHAGPAESLIHKTDAKYSITTLNRLESIVGDIVLGTDVTETSGNTAIQSREWPYASSIEQTSVKQLVRAMKWRMDWKLGTMAGATLTDPTGYNTSYLTGYGDARTLIKENKDFLREEMVAYMSVNYPSVKFGKTKTRQDTGYIVDAVVYSLTYGGNAMSIQAGLAYYDAEGSTSMLPASIKAGVLACISRLKTVMQQIVANTTVTRTTGNTAVQWTDSTNRTGGSAASTLIGNNIDIIYNLISGGATTSAPSITVTTITGTTTLATATAHSLTVGDTFVPRSTANGLTSGTKYYVVSTPLTTTFTLAASHGGAAITSFTNGSSLAIVGDVVDQPAATNAVTTTTALIAAYTTLSAQIPTIGTNAAAAITARYPGSTFDATKTPRDVRIILEAVGYDFMFNSNYRTVKAAYAYLRANSVELYTTANLKTYTRYALSYAATQALANVGGDATAQSRITTLMTLVDDIIFGAYNEGSICQTEIRAADWARLQLERNRAYIIAEISAYMTQTFKGTVTSSATANDIFTISDTSWLQRNAAIRFSGTVFGGVSTGTTYYVQNVVSSTTFTIATTRDATTPLNLSTVASGSMTVAYYFNSDLCLRDVGTMIDALKWDTMYPGNYKTLLAARYYANAVTGSLEEDMFYLRNGTGVRNMTLENLYGDLTPENSYGTSRVTAGAYASLDPGWGPADFRTWIISRSPYIQNCATFGNAAIGQKIDGSLHNGGNRSFVSNDFTQLISDGIGAWVTNNARAELVSVFSYYSYIGYLSEAGGRIRGTNGNNSYGTYGSVAEGYDVTETPNTAVVDNTQFYATVGSVTTDSVNQVYNFEFDNAGTDYTKMIWNITGSGLNVDHEGDEFRDDAVFQVRLLDNVDDSTAADEVDGNYGGYGYLSNANTAQGGTLTSITIAATDGESNSAYVGMKIVLTGGQGAGQYGIISSYNSGIKVVSVVKESTGAAGWDHMVPGTALQTPDASTTYLIEPRISFTSPGFTSTSVTMPTSGTWTDVDYNDTTTTVTGIGGTYSGSGTGATWDVQRNGSKYIVTQGLAGLRYSRLETITIAGTSLGGLTPTNDLTITITAVNSVTGAIQAWETSGYGMGGRFVAIRSGSQIGATSEDGISWTTRTTLMPSGAAWSALTSGTFDDNSSNERVARFVAVAGGSANTTAAYSADGITWTATSIQSSGIWIDVCFGEGKFAAIASDLNTVRISYDGEVWDSTGTLPTTGYTSIAYGMGLFVAVRSGTTNAAWSTDAVTWTQVSLPAGSAWSSVTWGRGIFVAVATNSNSGAYSIDGKNWIAMTIGAADGSSVSGYQKVAYGQGLFMATTYQAGVSFYNYVVTSEDGLNWTVRGTGATDSTSNSGWNAVAFGNPQRSGRFVAIMKDAGTAALSIKTGATAKARAFVAQRKIFVVRLTEPGSGYSSAPTMTITDPNNTFEAPFTIRTGKGAVATPSFKNRGIGYANASAEQYTSDGYADFFQDGQYIAVKRLTGRPVAGSNITFSHLPGQTFKLVNVYSFLGAYPGAYTAFFQVSPWMKAINSPAAGTTITTRIRYSQVRLTGHDFLDIGTGGFATTNYPNTPSQSATQANETVENNGGRVFFTSTDQDGNFRVGDLFTIEQSTGVATLNADAFNIAGLQELSLGNVTLGGNSATITEFSTDPYFTANSDNLVPTQRAIKAYISSQIGGGGASLNVNSVTAGSIYIATNQITLAAGTPAGTGITINARMNFASGVTGYPLAFNFYFL
jgi:hypothetical protein